MAGISFPPFFLLFLRLPAMRVNKYLRKNSLVSPLATAGSGGGGRYSPLSLLFHFFFFPGKLSNRFGFLEFPPFTPPGEMIEIVTRRNVASAFFFFFFLVLALGRLVFLSLLFFCPRRGRGAWTVGGYFLPFFFLLSCYLYRIGTFHFRFLFSRT